ncbi:MAG: C4-dicarboxylate transporter DcuC [Bacteroidales bacterium]
MYILSVILALAMIAITAFLLIKGYYPQMILLIAGIIMLILAYFLGKDLPVLIKPTGMIAFDLIAYLKESFSGKLAGVGLMIMSIGGYVKYMQHLGASSTLVKVAMKPISYFKKTPYLAAVLVIPIGQLTFTCVSSATGLGMLLMAAIYPVLMNLGISRVTAVSVITACTVFDLGPSSANSNQAASVLNMDVMEYFLTKQIIIVVPVTIALVILYYFVNKYFDKREEVKSKEVVIEEEVVSVPRYYAFFPVFPLLLLVLFSGVFKIFNPPVVLDTTIAMLFCTLVVFFIEWIRRKELKASIEGLRIFLNGMGTVFSSVVTLIVCADVFSKGLLSLGFINALIGASQALGFGSIGVNGLMTSMIYGSSVLMGSGNASFFAFSPLVPDIIAQLGGDASQMLLPMQLASSMGRACSPIAAVVIATSKIAGIDPFMVARRNIIPLSIGAALMFLLSTILI